MQRSTLLLALAAIAVDAVPLTRSSAARATLVHHSNQYRAPPHGTASTSAAAASSSATPRPVLMCAKPEDPPAPRSWLVRNRPLLLLCALVLHKCTTDGLTRWTRLQTDYSGATVAMMSELVKFPMLTLAIAFIGGGSRMILPTYRDALSRPFNNAWISLGYTFNNLLYYDALSALSATAYQVLSQSKTVFTAGLMYFIVGKRLLYRQVGAVGMLIAGALAVQHQEMVRSAASAAASSAGGSAVLYGVFLVLFSSFISALPNVSYEKVLKSEGENQYANNLLVTMWIIIWIGASNLALRLPAVVSAITAGNVGAPALSFAGCAAWVRAAFDGFTPAVWAVVALKALNGLLVPATFKYADNILYTYAKPSSIVLTTLLSCVATATLPSASLTIGVGLVVGSALLYNSKPSAKKD